MNMKHVKFAATIAMTLHSIAVFSATQTVNDRKWTYTVSGGKATISDLSYAGGAVTIPATLGGYPVVGIKGGSFYNGCYYLKSVTIPASLTSISFSAFSGLDGCGQLESFIVDANNPSYMSTNGLVLSKDEKTLVLGVNGDNIIPDSVTSIGTGAFYHRTGLSTVTVPSSVTSIGASAFSLCKCLTSITVPDGVTSIGNEAFYYCKYLTSVTIPDGVTNIGNSAFQHCSSLMSVTIPNSVTKISSCTFAGCSSLASVSIGNRVTSIEDSAFSGCNKIASISIPDSVSSIGRYAFNGCSSLKSLTIPDSVKSIGEYAFSTCSNLKSISLPRRFKGTTSILKGIPSDCAVRYYSTLTVSSLHGNPNPVVGAHTVFEDTATCSVDSPIHDYQDSDVYYLCTGWKGTANGTATIPIGDYRQLNDSVSTTLSLLDNSSITWTWQTNVWVFANGMPLAWDNPFGTSTSWHYEIGRADSGHTSCVRSGSVPAGQTSSLETAVTGPGSLSFDWKISANRGDYCRFLIDGAETNAITRSTSWNTVSLAIPAGSHELEWRYERNSATAAGDDAAFLDNVEWIPSVTLNVASEFGTATPAVGATSFPYKDSVVASVVAPEPTGGRKRIPMGWMGTGSVPASGTATNVAFTIEEDSTLTWQWKTQNQISVTASGLGACAFGTQWVDDGTTATATVVPSTALYKITLSGDTDGVTLNGATLSIPSNKPRSIVATVSEVKLNLNVSSAYGDTVPAKGRTEWSHGTMVSAHATAPEAENGTRRICTGWTGTGSVPASGTGAAVSFAITEDSSLTWNWETEYLVSLSTEGAVEADFSEAWKSAGSSIVVPYRITASYAELALAGDADGVTLDTAARTLTIPANRPRAVVLRTTKALTLGNALDSPSLVWSTDGNAPWAAQPDVSFDGEDAARSASVAPDGVSALEAIVIGSGEFRWRWKIVATSVAGIDVILDNDAANPALMLEEKGVWREAVLTISGNGTHTIRFEYWNTGGNLEDCAYLDCVTWSGETLESSLAKALDAPNLVWATDAGSEWMVENAESFHGSESVRSASVSGDGESGLETTVRGPGTLTWHWKLEVEGTAGLDVIVDGNAYDPAFAYDESGDWDVSSLTFDDDATHTIRFEFWNVDDCLDDCAYLDMVSWTPKATVTATQTTPAPVPYAWLRGFFPHMPDEYDAYESAAKEDAANGLNKVWECYVAGLNPTNATAAFRTVISIGADGAPVIGWEPKLSAAEEAKRTYTIYGRESLTDGDWGPTNAASRFFRVKVSMP